MDTVNLNGEGFEVVVTEGTKIKKGDLLMQFDLEFIREKAIPLFESWGFQVEILHAKETYLVKKQLASRLHSLLLICQAIRQLNSLKKVTQLWERIVSL